jgi:hypothetical protein
MKTIVETQFIASLSLRLYNALHRHMKVITDFFLPLT